MATGKWSTPAGFTGILTTEMDALASGSYTVVSAAIDNTSNLYFYINLDLFLASLTPTGSPQIAVYLLPSIDGTNYVDGGGSTAPPSENLLTTFTLSTSASAKRRGRTNMMIPPTKFKLVLLNSSGVTLASTGNILSYTLHTEQVV